MNKPSENQSYRCRRCGEMVDMEKFKCGCTVSPSPWEPVNEEQEVDKLDCDYLAEKYADDLKDARCKDFAINLTILTVAFENVAMNGTAIKFKSFEYCPWCGVKMEVNEKKGMRHP